MSQLTKFSTFILGLILFAGVAQAKPFKTEFIELELPPGWECTKENIDFVCQPDNLTHRSEAIVVLVVKNVNATDDNFEKYQAVLEESREMRDLLGNTYKSEVKYVRFKTIQGKKWIDSLQKGSEIPGFFTRYVASIEGKIAGLVTYSIAESVYAKWAPILEKMLESVKLRYDPQAFNDAMNATPGSLLGSRSGQSGRFAPKQELPDRPEESGSPLDITNLFAIILVIGGVGYYMWKKRNEES